MAFRVINFTSYLIKACFMKIGSSVVESPFMSSPGMRICSIRNIAYYYTPL